VALILRVVSSWSAWERRDPSEIVDYNFRAKGGGTDLRPSLYETADAAAEIVQVMAEHSSGSHSLKTMRGIDLSGICPRDPIPTPGDLRFTFTRERHRELVLKDRAELVEIVRQALQELETRTRVAIKQAIREYVAARVGDRDPEWLGFFSEHPERASRYSVRLP
jgi:hypothetical protein